MPASTPSKSSLAADHRQLIRPTSHIPWSVDVVSAVPKVLLGKLDQVAAGATCPSWACIAMRDGYVCVWPYQAIPLSDPLEAPKHWLKLFFTDLICSSESEPSPLLALSGDGEQSIYLYAYKKPYLVMKKVSRKDVSTSTTTNQVPRGHTTKTRVGLEDDDDEIVSLTADDNGVVVLGTSRGRLYWVTHTTIPVGLHLEKVELASGLWNRLFSSSIPMAGAPQHILPTSKDQFLSLCSVSGSIIRWDVSQKIASGHHASFEAHLEGTTETDLEDMHILKAVLSTGKDFIYSIVRGKFDGETRLYWIQSAVDGTTKASHWLSRFPLPDQVEVWGLSASENGNVYAAFSTAGVVTTMVLLVEGNIIQELDLPAIKVPALLPGLFAKDVVTHGCSMLATSGIGIRVRYLPRESPPSKKARVSSSNPTLLHTLAQHLRSYFWQSYQDVDIQRHIPPSLKQAQSSDLEEAIISLALELQHMGDTSSAQNPMEWHKAFCKLLQQGGLYRSISQRGRWKLLSIGQELAVFGPLTHMASNEWQSSLKSYDIADWLLDIQTEQSNLGWPKDKHAWNILLGNSLNAAIEYRDEHAHAFYDIVSETPLEPIWLSHPSLQMVLKRQLEEWGQNIAQGVEQAQLEAVVKASLCSFSESYKSAEEYVKIKAMAIALLRSANNDELAFELSIQYLYFKGLCQISVDHEKRRDASMFSLDELFSTIEGMDILSGYSFAQFVLQWHTDMGLFGHAINYGRFSPTDLTYIMNKDERLRGYRWIPAIRQNYYEYATVSCLEICDENNQMGSNHWALSMAKLSNKLAATQNKDREIMIEKRLELVDAQKILTEGEDNCKEAPLQKGEELVRLALKKLKNAGTMDERVEYAATALAVCTSIDSATEQVAQVWADCLRLDSSVFTRWLQNETDLTSTALRKTVLKSTLFGWLLTECRKDPALSEVTYGRHIEKAVMDKIGGKAELTRLLRSVTAPTDSIQGSSLVVASF